MTEPESHDWHLFDQEAGWEVARIGDTYYVRAVGKDGHVTMTPEEFDQWRQHSPRP